MKGAFRMSTVGLFIEHLLNYIKLEPATARRQLMTREVRIGDVFTLTKIFLLQGY